MLNLTKAVEWTAEVETEIRDFKLEWNLETLTIHSRHKNKKDGYRMIEDMGAADVNRLADAMKNMVTMGDDRFPAGKA